MNFLRNKSSKIMPMLTNSNVGRRSISYSSKGLEKMINLGRKQSPTLDDTFTKIEHHETKLRNKIDALPKEHDIHKVPGYKEAFLKSKELHIEENRAKAPHYDYKSHKVSLMNPNQHDQTTHEATHALDSLSQNIHFSNPRERLFSEFNAFDKQNESSMEISRKSPANFEGRTPLQMAKSYEGKKDYPGTFEESKNTVSKRLKSKTKYE